MDNHRSEKVAIIAGIGSRAEKIAPLALLGAMLNQKGLNQFPEVALLLTCAM